MKITIKLLSDLCTCSGETYNSMVDMDVVYDEYGIPYIPAKRIKGCIREAALEMMQMDIISQERYDGLFGKEGNANSAFSLSNAYIRGYDDAVNALKACRYKGLSSQQNVLNQYTSTRTQTAVDLETGVADANSLRTMRVVNKGLVFEAECDVKGSAEDKKVLTQAVSLVKHMGISRTRGLGLVDLVLGEEDEKKISHVKIGKDQLGDHNKMRYQITLRSAMICKSAKGNQADTQDYIAGSKILGLIAGLMGEEAYREMMAQKDEVIVSNAYIMKKDRRCTPGKISLQKEKDQPYDADGSMRILDMLYDADIENKQMSPAGIDYISADGEVADVTTEISYHHQRPQDKSIGRATGKEDGSSFYQLCSISADQVFGGYIYANKTQAESILDALEGAGHIRLGYGKSSEFGAVNLVVDEIQTEEQSPEVVHEAILTLVSDVILYNENGVLTTDLNVLTQYLQEVTGVTDLVLSRPFLKFATIGGFNVKWRRRKPIFHALGKGSTCRITSETGVDMNLLNRTFIGERVAEGYGEIHVEKTADTAEVYIHKDLMDGASDGQTCDENTDIIQRLLRSECEQRMQSRVRERLAAQRKQYEKQADALNAAISKLRIIYKTESTYEDMLTQIRGIEDAQKNGLCTSLVGLVVPETLQKEVIQEMKKDYQMTLHTTWNAKDLYKNVYRAYITELKQFVKTVEKKGDTK